MRRLVQAVLVLGLLVPVPSASALVAGSPTSAGRYPWYVSVDGCGGTLIAADRVLTAAHCVAGKTPSALGRVRFGGSLETRLAVAAASEPRYVTAQLDGTENPLAARYDVAVVALDRPVSDIAPIRLLGPGDVAVARPGRRGEVIGRGATSSRSSGPLSSGRGGLRRASLALMSDAACNRYWRGYGDAAYHDAFIAGAMLCAGDPRHKLRAGMPRRSICQGDSGGPLLVRTRDGSVRQAGVVSWLGDHCGVGPSVFAEVGGFREFLDRHDEPWAPIPSKGRAVITGTPRVGATLTCTAPSWIAQPATVEYRWASYRARDTERRRQRGPSTTYVVGAEDLGRRIRCLPMGVTAGGLAPVAGAETAAVTD
jgi:hypothetical protein